MEKLNQLLKQREEIKKKIQELQKERKRLNNNISQRKTYLNKKKI